MGKPKKLRVKKRKLGSRQRHLDLALPLLLAGLHSLVRVGHVALGVAVLAANLMMMVMMKVLKVMMMMI